MKILLVNQSSVLKTGYGILGKTLLEYLKDYFEVAELACDVRTDDPRNKELPWKVWGNLPKSIEEEKDFLSNPLASFGITVFDKVVQQYKPTHVISINDPWAASWIGKHHYKKYFNFIWMPTIDAKGLSKEWLYEFNLADKILTYQNWSSDVLKAESGKLISYGEGPYIPKDFTPLSNRKDIKKKLGLDKFVIGTTMRNQARKRFPELFAAFKKVLDVYPETILYCHCSYPDLNCWNIPEELLNFEIANNVYFSFICQNCNELWPSKFRINASCPKCKQLSGIMCNGNLSMPVEQMNIMYNCFDLYVQPANMEGLGMPLLEAGACGTPIIGTNYASLVDVIPKLNGELFYSDLQKDENSSRWYAAVSIDNMAEKIINSMKLSEEELDSWRVKTRKGFEENYNLEKTLNAWKTVIESCDKAKWDSPKNIVNIPVWNDKLLNMKNSDFVKWCIKNILKDESKINTLFETKLITELDTQVRNNKRVKITKKDIFNELCVYRNYVNHLEYSR